MSTNRKTCRVCKKRKMYSQFYQRSNGSNDGYWHECKECTATRTKAYRYGECPRCGAEYYKGGGEQLCKQCRNAKKKVAPVVTQVYASCGRIGSSATDGDDCKFLDDCNYRVKVKKNANWLPYCFVESQYHDAWLKEYA